MTNAERIRTMSVRKLAEIIKFYLECDKCPRQTNRGCDGDCAKGAREWLKQEVSDDEPRLAGRTQ